MCRLLLSYNQLGHSEEEKYNFLNALNLMKSGGPDSQGYIIYANNSILMGHNRLALRDLSSLANQPYNSSSKISRIIFNGEIYNHMHLRDMLPNRNWITKSDTETLVELIEAFGPSLIIPKLKGMFAFVFHDLKKNLIYIARDKSGIKPLFISYPENESHLIISSEIKGIINARKNHKYKISEEARNEYFYFGYIRQPNTIFNKIRSVQTDGYLEFNPRENILLKRNLIPSEIKNNNNLEDILTHALELRLQKDLEIPFFLSGGIDSNLLVAIAKRNLNINPTTISATFQDTCFDESSYINQNKVSLGLEKSNLINIKPDSFIHNIIDNINNLTDQPFADSSFVVTKYLCNFARQMTFKAYIGADGADECFWGYKKYRKLILYQKFRNLFFLPLVRNSNRKINYSAVNKLDEFDIYLSSKDHPFDTNYFKEGNRLKTFTPLDCLQYDRKSYLQSDILVKCDLAGMSESIENREVFLDENVINWSDNYYRNFSSSNQPNFKEPLRNLLKKLFPNYRSPKNKMGFATPIPHWSITDSKINHLISKELNEKSLKQIFPYKVPDYISSYEILNLEQRIKYHSSIWLYYCWSKFYKSL